MDRPRPLPKADNLRAHRRRKREGKVVVRVEISGDQVETLADLGLLELWDEQDPRKISLAIPKLIDAASEAL